MNKSINNVLADLEPLRQNLEIEPFRQNLEIVSLFLYYFVFYLTGDDSNN